MHGAKIQSVGTYIEMSSSNGTSTARSSLFDKALCLGMLLNLFNEENWMNNGDEKLQAADLAFRLF